MKKLIASLAATTLAVSASLTTSSAWSYNQISDSNTNPYFQHLANTTNNKQEKEVYSHLAQRNPYHQFKTDDPQTIINDITTDHFFVPANTNPDLNNPQTIATIKSYLEKNNPKLSDSDLKYITLYPAKFGEKLSPSIYNQVVVSVTEGSVSAFKTIYVKLASTPAPSTSINLYNPDLPSTDAMTVEKDYYDDVFLKSLIYNPQNKSVTSSSKQLTDPQDISDYKIMVQSGNVVRGLTLVNRYLKNGFIQYVNGGIIPTRQQLQSGVKQGLIVRNSSVGGKKLAANSGLSDYISFQLHWWGFDITLKPLLIASFIEHFFYEVVNDAFKATEAGSSTAFDIPGFKTGTLMTSGFAEALGLASASIIFIITMGIIGAVNALLAVLPAIGEAIDLLLDPELILIAAMVASLIGGAVTKSMDPRNEQYGVSPFGNLPPTNYFAIIDNLHKGTPTDVTVEDPKASDPVQMGLTFEFHFFAFWNNKFSIYFGKHQDSLPYSINPSNFKSSLGKPSTITGNANDFTISAGYDDLDSFVGDLGRPDVQTLPKLFKAMNWKNVANFQGLTVKDLSNLEQSDPQGWELPAENYMATIHVVKTNGIYQVAWTNLDNEQDKKVLPETNGDLNASFINETNNGLNYLNSFTNERVYSDIAARYRWVESNWKQIIKGKQITEKTPEQYFEDTVLKSNHVNLYQVSINDLINSMTVLTSLFKPEVEGSHLLKTAKSMKSDSTIINTYFSDTNPLNPIVQADA